MTKQALTALKKSIAHWQRLATGKTEIGETVGTKHCALCQEYLDLVKGCDGCPVKKVTKQDNCVGSPYGRASLIQIFAGQDSIRFKKAARVELQFLQSLLPKKKSYGSKTRKKLSRL